MKAKLIKHDGHSYLLVLDEKLVAFVHPKDFSKNDTIGKLSLENCQAIERGYDLDELADEWVFEINGHKWSNNDDSAGDNYGSFKIGFQKALELNNTKLYTFEDMVNCWNKALTFQEHKKTLGEHIQSLQQTEWDVEVEIDEEKEFIFDPTMGISQGHYLDKPKLDENGCLILKKI